MAGVYVGYDLPRALGKRETGTSAAVPIFKRFMTDALEDAPKIDFRRPNGINLIPVHSETGKRVRASDPDAIIEAFKPGQKPGETVLIDVPGRRALSATVDAPALY